VLTVFPQGGVTYEGLVKNVAIGILFIQAWLRGEYKCLFTWPSRCKFLLTSRSENKCLFTWPSRCKFLLTSPSEYKCLFTWPSRCKFLLTSPSENKRIFFFLLLLASLSGHNCYDLIHGSPPTVRITSSEQNVPENSSRK